MIEITSASNEKFKFFKTLLTKKGRDESSKYMVEGIKSVRDAIDAGADIDALILSEDVDFHAAGDFLVYRMPKILAHKLSDTKTPQGVYAVLNKPKTCLTLSSRGAYVYCDRISDPGNLGTIIRTCDSAGFDGVLLSAGCVEVYNPKTIRACMGSFFHVKVEENIGADTLSSFIKDGGRVYGGVLSPDAVDYRQMDAKGGIIIAVGNEANGISEEIKNILQPVIIPIYGRAESLNAAVAASLLMYEAANRRNVKN